MGEIRLQWWRDALAMPAAIRTGHPVADAVREAAHRHQLPVGLLETLIDGRLLLLAKGVPLDDGALSDLLWKTEGALFALAPVSWVCRRAPMSTQPVSRRAAPTAWRACCLACRERWPRARSSGQVSAGGCRRERGGPAFGCRRRRDRQADRGLFCPNSPQFGGRAAICAAACRGRGRVAFLPLALVEPYLRVLARSGPALLREEAGVAPLTRVCRIAAAHVFGRLVRRRCAAWRAEGARWRCRWRSGGAPRRGSS